MTYKYFQVELDGIMAAKRVPAELLEGRTDWTERKDVVRMLFESYGYKVGYVREV